MNLDFTVKALSKIEIYPDDTFLVSYPRSGNTWCNHLFSAYFEKPALVAEIYQQSAQALSQVKRPRIIKIHCPFHPSLPKVIYLVRDGRDVAVSNYHFKRKRKKIDSNTAFEVFVDQFNLGRVNKFGLWNDHVNSWLDNGGDRSRFLLVKYEDLKHDPQVELARMLRFLGQTRIDLDKLDRAVKKSEFAVLQKKEQAGELFSKNEEEAGFFRKGVVGDWKNYFTDETLNKFLLFHRAALDRLGYLP